MSAEKAAARRTSKPIVVEGTAKCWDGCGGTILVKVNANWFPKKYNYAYCDRCGLVYSSAIIRQRSDYTVATETSSEP